MLVAQLFLPFIGALLLAFAGGVLFGQFLGRDRLVLWCSIAIMAVAAVALVSPQWT